MNCADILKSLAEIEAVILESYNDDTPTEAFLLKWLGEEEEDATD
jgi:hypothetical protein